MRERVLRTLRSMDEVFANLRGIVWMNNATLNWYAPRTSAIWEDSNQARFGLRADDDLCQRFMASLPRVRDFFAAGHWVTRRFESERYFGAASPLIAGTGLNACIAVFPLSLNERPLEWAVFPCVMLIIASDRTSVVLLTARDIETLQIADIEFFGIDRTGMHSSEVFSPCHAFESICRSAESVGDFVMLGSGVYNPVDVESLVLELRRLKCACFEDNIYGDKYIPLLKHLHVIILNMGMAGVRLVKRAHFFRTNENLFRFYEDLHWVSRSGRLSAYVSSEWMNQPVKDQLVGFQAVSMGLNEWVRSFKSEIPRAVKRDGKSLMVDPLEYDGIMDQDSFELSFEQLVERLGRSQKCRGHATVTHAHVLDGITLQWEEEAEVVPFDSIKRYLETSLEQKRCGPHCSVQIRWTLSQRECESKRGRKFCSTLKETGLHIMSGLTEDLLQSSIGFVEGFTTPYFMCRRSGTFVGHTEQGGTAAFGCLLNGNSPSMKWEAMYVPYGPVFDSVRSLMNMMASAVNLLPEYKDRGAYPGPLLWSDDPQGILILEAHGIKSFYGNSFQQDPGKFSLTSTSRFLGDYGLFVEYHQTKTVNDERQFDRDPIVLFSQNAAPLGNPEWCRDVVDRILLDVAGDSVLRCWGVGLLAFLAVHSLSSPAKDELVAVAKRSVVKDIIFPAMVGILERGPQNWRPRNMFANLSARMFAFDLYSGNDVLEEETMFHQVVCGGCDFVLSTLYIHTKAGPLCINCQPRGKITGYVFDIDELFSLLEITPMQNPPPDVFSTYQGGELEAEFSRETCHQISQVIASETHLEIQRLLSHLFRIESDMLRTNVPLQRGMRIPMSHVITLAINDAAKCPWSRVNLPRFLCFGMVHFLLIEESEANCNCQLSVDEDQEYVELIIFFSLPAQSILIACLL